MPCQNNVYPGKAQQFLEAVLKNPETSRGFARNSKRLATSLCYAARVVVTRLNRPGADWSEACIVRRQIVVKIF
jgi:hypothetical protein